MREVYRKQGVTVRVEADRRIVVREAGEAIEEGGRFFCQPLAAPRLEPDPEHFAAMEERVEAAAAAIRAAVPHPLSIERLLVSEGEARHEFGETTWDESFRRVHLAIVRGSHRVLIDRGNLDVEEIAQVADTFARMEKAERPKGEVRLSASVAAALLPQLVGVAPPNITLMQSAAGRDGKGQIIGEWTVDRTTPPNWFRPSYRVRPQRLPLHLRATCSVSDIDANLPQAVALTAPPRGLELSVLVRDGRVSYPATIQLTRIDAIGRDAVWYPYAAGAFGAEMAVL